MAFALDTSCIVALLCPWHEHHHATAEAVQYYKAKEPPLIIPAPTLAESYAALTRQPPPHRVDPEIALEAIARSFRNSSLCISLEPDDYWEELAKAANKGLASGAIHDAIIACCARKGGATTILTLNYRHFIRFAVPGFDIIDPRSYFKTPLAEGF